MTIRDDILAVMRATGKPLQSKEIARVLYRSTPEVASHLGYMAKKGIVIKRSLPIGEPIHYGHYSFPSGGATIVWIIPGTMKREVLQKVRHDARVHSRLPRAVEPRGPEPHTDDMIQMLDDLRAQIHRCYEVPFNLLGNRK